MNTAIDKTIKHYVNKQGTVIFVCSDCNASKQINVEPFRNKKHNLRLRCTCGKVHSIGLDFREKYRKSVVIPAMISGNSSKLLHPVPCTVTDLSMGGIALTANKLCNTQEEDELQISFQLDNKLNAKVRRRIRIVHTGPTNIMGCRFIDSVIESEEKALYFYLLNA